MTSDVKHDWMICFLTNADGFFFSHDPFSLGPFEFTRRPDILPGCEKALVSSANAFSYKLNVKKGMEPLRMRTFIHEETEKSVIRLGKLFAKETLSLMNFITVMPSNFQVLRPGYLFNLTTGQAKPILPTERERSISHPYPQAILDEIAVEPYQILNLLLSADPKIFGELGMALRRSTHWSGLAIQADDGGERLLLHWMACETLTRSNEHENLAPKLLAALGFPRSRYLLALPEEEKKHLEAISDYRIWSTRLNKLYDEYRIARNDIAHSGYRELDLSDKFSSADYTVLKRAINMTTPRVQGLAVNGLILGIKTIAELWDQYGKCKLYLTENPLANEVRGTIIYSLKQKTTILDE